MKKYKRSNHEGALPAILDTKSGYLKSYKIYGNTGGVGEREAVILDEPLNGVGTDNDTLNLSNGLLTRKIMKKVFDGTENFAVVSSGANKYFRTSIADYPCTNDNNCLCTHFVPRSVASTNTYVAVRTHVPSSSFGAAIAIRPENVSNMTVDDFKAWLASEYNAGTPVTVWYVLETPISTTIDVPQGYTYIIEGYTMQTGTPTQAAPIYPVCNGEKQQDGSYAIRLTRYKIPITSKINMWCSELETKVNPSAPENNYIHLTVTRSLPTESTIQETGVIYYREADANTLTSLTIDTPDAASKHGSILTPSGSYGTNLLDTGNGIAFVGYVVIGGVYYYSNVYYYTWEYVKEREPISFPDPTPVTTDIYIGDELLGKNEYVDSLSGKIVRIRDVRSELDFSITEPYPTVNASGVGRVTVVKSISWETELTIVETGLIYVKDISNTDELILENVGIHGIDKRITSEDTREHTLNLTDPDGNGARTVGYAIVTDGTYETTLYSEEAKATYQQLVDEPGQSHLYPGHDDVGSIPDPQNPPVPLPRIPTFDGSTTITYMGTPAPSNVVLDNNMWIDMPYKLYTDTLTAFPVTFSGDGSSIANWTISGNCVQNGVPTPDNPVAVEECGELVETGEHAGEYAVSILLNGVTTNIYLSEPLRRIGNYADTVDSNGEVVRRIYKLVLTGEETIDGGSPGLNAKDFIIYISNSLLPGSPMISTHYVDGGMSYQGQIGEITQDEDWISFFYLWMDKAYNTTSFKTWLATQYANGTPVTIYYVLRNPTSEQTTPVTLTTVSGSNVLDFGTALKPARFQGVNGWAERTEKKRVNGEWI